MNYEERVKKDMLLLKKRMEELPEVSGIRVYGICHICGLHHLITINPESYFKKPRKIQGLIVKI